MRRRNDYNDRYSRNCRQRSRLPGKHKMWPDRMVKEGRREKQRQITCLVARGWAPVQPTASKTFAGEKWNHQKTSRPLDWPMLGLIDCTTQNEQAQLFFVKRIFEILYKTSRAQEESEAERPEPESRVVISSIYLNMSLAEKLDKIRSPKLQNQHQVRRPTTFPRLYIHICCTVRILTDRKSDCHCPVRR